ncbi:hypothetical protein NPIL_516761 [Nephila pilipes]|uniref:Uncharacterized protein n=1 Tax=Nephila pilipes TaxID=299642 RepID=A0A8X6P4L4_NEPPI|nr:hypothetical protein NPIL_516761 [Nephila pilipes]
MSLSKKGRSMKSNSHPFTTSEEDEEDHPLFLGRSYLGAMHMGRSYLGAIGNEGNLGSTSGDFNCSSQNYIVVYQADNQTLHLYGSI